MITKIVCNRNKLKETTELYQKSFVNKKYLKSNRKDNEDHWYKRSEFKVMANMITKN